jgi:type IV pilus assembly protein PilB
MNTELKVASKLNGLARRLVEENVLNTAQAEDACTQAAKKNKSLLSWLIHSNAAEPGRLAAAAASEFGIPLIDIRAFDLSQAPLSLVSEALIEKHQALPLHLRGNQLFIGLKDPTDHEVLEEIAFSSGFHVEPILVASDQLAPAIQRAMEATNPVFDDLDDEDGLETIGLQADIELSDDANDPSVDETPVVRFINKVLLDAIRKGASDIHFEPYETKYRIRYRLDGVLQQVASPPIQMSRRCLPVKVMARLDIAEKRVPGRRIKQPVAQKDRFAAPAPPCLGGGAASGQAATAGPSTNFVMRLYAACKTVRHDPIWPDR